MTKKQKPLRELKRNTRRVVNDALASLRDLRKELGADERTPYNLCSSIRLAINHLKDAKEYGVPWWKNS